jgi:DNA-binding MarR family transcriptional regulator
MHSVHFAMRRAFHKSWQRGMAITKRYKLTPTRVDILHILREQDGCALRQRELRRRLGTTSPVVSKLLRKLEKCGLVKRMASAHDRRRNDVVLTPAGKRLIDTFYEEVIAPGVARRDVESFVAVDGGDEYARRTATNAFRFHLLRMRRLLGDVGTVAYREPPARRRGDHRPIEELIEEAREAELEERYAYDYVLPDGTMFIPHDPSAPLDSWSSYILRGGVSGAKEEGFEDWLVSLERTSVKLRN